ncbi:ATP-binding cassette domain-containing protein [Allosaccharopolyspora coralli]|uniref:ABC-type quaternary amine transporter n=2 Tax=Allosaccharopolyspora coralli TaxID=2665642 RepID=A0A5Q3QLI2_9PSEU|nr:ATP-binding cassette domain-containing protein [Allosaccharopolyspora coralli]
MIRLENLTKSYPGQSEPAVRELTLDVPAGEIVVFVGPSGCGKTTTMKLVNRLIEPTSGRIHLDGTDVTEVNPDLLRRKIGYTIQQTGLFPHRTVADNIATVPKMLGWKSRRISERVDELLRLVGLDPALYRDRYPKQLSGGQQQRIGVARALGADPDVMLMDEPFGAIDPLNRESLQNEFLRIQADLRKTIVFVTHDVDEAIKMGDRIAVFRQGGEVVQYDTPERILAEPADEFVREFLGSGTSVKRLSLTPLSAVDVPRWSTVSEGDVDSGEVAAAPGEFRLVLDGDDKPAGWLSACPDGGPGEIVPLISLLGPDDTLFDALDQMLSLNSSAATVVDADGRYRGVLDLDTIRSAINVEPRSAPVETLQEV